MMRKRFVPATMSAALLLAALLALAGDLSGARGEGPLAFGIQPPADSGVAARSGYFAYVLQPGETVSDEAVVTNSGEAAITLRVYAADGVTAINGGTAFAAAGEELNGAWAWLSTTASAVTLGPGQGISVPFTVTVPAAATAGDHVAGWVVEAPPRTAVAQGVQTNVLERAGVAVVVHVPGATTENLVLGSVCLNQETGSNYFEVQVANDGNVLTKGKGTFTLYKDELEVFSRPADLGTVLPGDATVLRLDAPFDPGPGGYEALITLKQTSGDVVEARSPIEIGEEKANGCTAVAGAVENMEGRRGFLEGVGGGLAWPLLAALAGLLFALVALRAYLSWRSR